MTDLVAFLRSSPITAGLTVHDSRVSSAPGTFTPVGVIWHHTAGAGTALGTMQNGRPDLPPPLGNALVQRDGAVHITADGRANDTGMGSGVVLNEVLADAPPGADAYARGLPDTTGLTRWFYDIEVDNNGTGEPYPYAQLDSLVRVTAALLVAHGWSSNRCRHHRQMTRRKIDMSYRGDLWTPTALHALSTQPPPNGGPPPMGITDDRVAALHDGLVAQFARPDGGSHNHGFAIQNGHAAILRVEAMLGTIAGELAAVRTAADAAATTEEVAGIIDASLGSLLDAITGLPDGTGEPVTRETVRLLLIDLLESAAEDATE